MVKKKYISPTRKKINAKEKRKNAIKFQGKMFVYWRNSRKQNPSEISRVSRERHSCPVTVTAES